MDIDALLELPLAVESVAYGRRERDTSSGFTRVTTVIELAGNGVVGRGEDVTYAAAAHDIFADRAPALDLPFTGTLRELSTRLDGVALFPQPPERDVFQHYRRWGFESAALDLALRQAGTNLASQLDGRYRPIRFVVSTSLGDPPSIDRLESLLTSYPDLEFKLDPTPDWTPELIDAIARLDAVRVLDCKAVYHDADVGYEPDETLYRRLVEAFPEAIIEDPGLTVETRPVFEGGEHRVSWDAPMTSLDTVRNRPLDSGWLNIKPSRFGTVEAVLRTVEFCLEHDISLYGGGQFELGVGRGQIQALASLFYPDCPNDVAPSGFNEPDVIQGLPTSPLDPPSDPSGFGR